MSACVGADFPLSLAREIAGEPEALPGEAAEVVDAVRERYRLVQPVSVGPDVEGRHFAAVLHRFRYWRARPEACAAADYELEAALAFGFAEAWEETIDLCRAAFDCYSEGGRQREAGGVHSRSDGQVDVDDGRSRIRCAARAASCGPTSSSGGSTSSGGGSGVRAMAAVSQVHRRRRGVR